MQRNILRRISAENRIAVSERKTDCRRLFFKSNPHSKREYWYQKNINQASKNIFPEAGW